MDIVDIVAIVFTVVGLIVAIVVGGYVESTQLIQKYKQKGCIYYGNG